MASDTNATHDDKSTNTHDNTQGADSKSTEELHGLPHPQDYTGPYFSVLEYAAEEYADGKTLDDKIRLRGTKYFAQHVSPEDFDENENESNGSGGSQIQKTGFAELWADSTWEKNSHVLARNVKLEQLANSVKQSDCLWVIPSVDEKGWLEYSFYTNAEEELPYCPYHDFDDDFFRDAFSTLKPQEAIVCIVQNLNCFGGDGVEADPDFCWRVYDCKVTVYKIAIPTSKDVLY